MSFVNLDYVVANGSVKKAHSVIGSCSMVNVTTFEVSVVIVLYATVSMIIFVMHSEGVTITLEATTTSTLI